ncbi:MAG TPA: PmoA family protein [Candidatus Hydrogenedentes bacterium]|nr:PmoA family protein [Candidatus Hydrogenedentota bacterium]HPG65394.1 PmoA family protein [Candidatus Hydrogenedentota bacterium]
MAKWIGYWAVSVVALVGCMTAAGPASAADDGTVAITKQDGADALDVVINGEPFTTYHYSNENRKPFLWPVYAEGGVTITRNWPMGEDVPASGDHVHHKSIWTAYGDVNGVDCWGEEGENSGYQHSGEVTFGAEGGQGWIHAKNVWQDKDHKPVLTEERRYRFYAGPASARYFDTTITFAATEGDVKFGDTKEGGILSFRMRPEIEVKRRNAEITLVDMKGYPKTWGKPSPWCDYSGTIAGVGMRGIAVFDHPENLRYPTRWHVRDYGLCGANCFGLSHFTEHEMKKEGKEPLNGDYLLKAGESLTFNYRVLIHSGTAEEAKVADLYAEYAKLPKASVED